MSTVKQRQMVRELAEYAKRTNLLDLSGYQLKALIHSVSTLVADIDRLEEELATVRARLDAVPVDDIRKVTKAADMDGYNNWAVEVWLDELEQPQPKLEPLTECSHWSEVQYVLRGAGIAKVEFTGDAWCKVMTDHGRVYGGANLTQAMLASGKAKP